MTKNKKIIIFVLVVLSASIFVGFRFVPVLSVQGKRASYSEFLKIRSAIEKTNFISKDKIPGDLNSVAMMNLMEQEFLDILIDSVDHNLKSKAEDIVAEAIAKTPDLSLDNVSEELYGLSSVDFKKLVLLPQAKRDLVENYFKKNNQDIIQAWTSLYGTASVKIYYPGYYWDTKEYAIKKK